MRQRITTVILTACFLVATTAVFAHEAPRAATAPKVDGLPGDPAWIQSEWREIPYLMLGSMPEPDDFTGRYKVVWTPEHLYLLAEITDDILVDSHTDPLELYWEDDTLEIFIDEDASGGLHRFDYNAFAYHIALDNQAVDMGPFRTEADREAGKFFIRTFPEHVYARWQRSLAEPHRLYWEARISVHDDKPAPVRLSAGKIIGFMVAYCDSDGPGGREHFMGDVEIEAVDGDRNLGYIDASVFGELMLVESNDSQ